MSQAPESFAPKPVNLALQGGGAHGAFTWGVLDALLEDGRLAVKAITGASAGAMNAVVFAEGFLEGGAEGARRQLETFWREISRKGRMSPLRRPLLERFMTGWSLDDSPGMALFENWSRLFSPYDTNPLNLNPLRDFIAELISFDKLKASDEIRLFISATNVRSGDIRIFENAELSADVVMASACLPQIFQAVEIGGQAYWDGGYLGNPALFPLLDGRTPDDTILVQINPVRVREVPQAAGDIANRLNEITFNASLHGELRAIALMQRRAKGTDSFHDIRLHRIALGAKEGLDASSKLNTEWDFLIFLRDQGRQAAKNFLTGHFDAIGARATLDLAALLG
ncbi:patatin-like phospholipase family protein [Labrys neptuniae]